MRGHDRRDFPDSVPARPWNPLSSFLAKGNRLRRSMAFSPRPGFRVGPLNRSSERNRSVRPVGRSTWETNCRRLPRRSDRPSGDAVYVLSVGPTAGRSSGDRPRRVTNCRRPSKVGKPLWVGQIFWAGQIVVGQRCLWRLGVARDCRRRSCRRRPIVPLFRVALIWVALSSDRLALLGRRGHGVGLGRRQPTRAVRIGRPVGDGRMAPDVAVPPCRRLFRRLISDGFCSGGDDRARRDRPKRPFELVMKHEQDGCGRRDDGKVPAEPMRAVIPLWRTVLVGRVCGRAEPRQRDGQLPTLRRGGTRISGRGIWPPAIANRRDEPAHRFRRANPFQPPPDTVRAAAEQDRMITCGSGETAGDCRRRLGRRARRR